MNGHDIATFAGFFLMLGPWLHNMWQVKHMRHS
jgi:hypothetical protein